MTIAPTKYRKDIQVLRGIAVAAVVLFHANEDWFSLGYLGVDVFFVISGFVVTPLIVRIFTKEAPGGIPANLVSFYKRRFYRLAPALGTSLAGSAIFIFLVGSLVDHERFARQGLATLLILGNLGAYRYSGDYFSPNPNPLVHTWSLSVEEQIYIALPILLILLIRNRTKVHQRIVSVLLGITAISGFIFIMPSILQPIYSKFGIATPSQFGFYSPLSRIWQFCIGGVIYFLYQRRKTISSDIPLLLHAILIFILCVAIFTPIQLDTRLGSITASTLTALVIYFRSLATLPRRLETVMEWLGDRSYSIYLVHLPILYIATYSPLAGGGGMLQTTIGVGLSIGLGAMSFSKVEQKFRVQPTLDPQRLTPIRNIFSIFVLVPILLFALMLVAERNNYWGLNRNPIQPPYAGNVDPNCQRDSVNGPPCVYLYPNADKTVLLIGDSHAGHISQALLDAARIAKWNAVIWTHAGCHVQFENSPDKSSQAATDPCLENSHEMLTWVEVNRPDSIVVSQFLEADTNQTDLMNALKILQSRTAHLLLVAQNPIFPDKKFMSTGALLGNVYSPPKSVPVQDMDQELTNLGNEFKKLAVAQAIEIIDTSSLFCDSFVCTRWSSEGWLYRDHNHFSILGAERTVPEFAKYLNGIS